MDGVDREVAVVGSGLAGLAAAWELARRGLRVRVLERQASVGGRARSGQAEGFVLEPLGCVLSTADHELLGWVAAAGARDALLPLRPLLTAQVHGGRVAELDPRRLRDFARIPGVRWHEALRLLRLPRLMRRYGGRLDPTAPERAAALDDRSLADFARLYFGASVLAYWMAPFVTSTSLGDEAETSRVRFLLQQRRHFGARRGLPRAGLAELLEATAGRLPTLCGAEVVGLRTRGRKLAVRYVREGSERVLEADAVVLATSAPEAARIGEESLTAGERAVLAGVRYTPAATLAVATCRPLSWHALEIRVPHAERSPLERIVIEPGMAGGRVPDGYGGVSLHATGRYAAQALRLPEETLVKELLDAFEAVHPGGRAAVDFTRAFRIEAAWPRFDVGHYRRLARLARLEADGRREGRRVYLAGDYRMEPSWNGAVASGLRAAAALAADL